MWQVFRESKSAKLVAGYGGLFTSFGTLLCCALPSTLVLLGFGASLAGFLGEFPELIWLSENKEWVFGISFLMLGVSYLGQRYAASQACPIDKKEDCETTKDWSKSLFYITLTINLVGAFYAFILPSLL
jgi:mercuric ion transport protein